MVIDKKSTYINWLTAILWGWSLLSYWTDLPIPPFLVPNTALTAFLILCLQIAAHCNIKNILTFKDLEINFIAIISIITIIFLFISKSGFGAFFTILNLCLLWYLSDKWRWNHNQIVLIGIVIAYLYISWFFKPMQLGINTNSNTTGTITVFTMLTLITCIEYLFSKYKWIYILEFVFLCFSIQKLLIYHGRGAFVALIFYVILRLISFTNLWRKEIFYKALCYFLTLGSIIFVFAYTLIWKLTGINFVVPYWNKSLYSGRERIWYELWTYYKDHILTGIGSNVTLQSWPEYNVHNAIYNILVTHGIIVFILVMIYMIHKMIKLYRTFKNSSIFIPAMSGILAIYMESFFDMDLLWFPQFLVWTVMLIVLASSSSSREDI